MTASNPKALRIILAAVVLGPPVGVALIGLPVLLQSDSLRDVVMMLALGYVFGTLPALIGAILFVLVRGWLGTGYIVAGLCGWISTFTAFTLLSGRYDLWTLVFAVLYGALPALIVRGLTRRAFDQVS